MKSFTLFSILVRFSFLALNSFLITAAVALLAQTNSGQTNTLQMKSQPQQKLTSLQASTLEMTDTLGWLVFIGLQVLAGSLDFAKLKHKQKAILKKNSASQKNTSDEENYFG